MMTRKPNGAQLEIRTQNAENLSKDNGAIIRRSEKQLNVVDVDSSSSEDTLVSTFERATANQNLNAENPDDKFADPDSHKTNATDGGEVCKTVPERACKSKIVLSDEGDDSDSSESDGEDLLAFLDDHLPLQQSMALKGKRKSTECPKSNVMDENDVIAQNMMDYTQVEVPSKKSRIIEKEEDESYFDDDIDNDSFFAEEPKAGTETFSTDSFLHEDEYLDESLLLSAGKSTDNLEAFHIDEVKEAELLGITTSVVSSAVLDVKDVIVKEESEDCDTLDMHQTPISPILCTLVKEEPFSDYSQEHQFTLPFVLANCTEFPLILPPAIESAISLKPGFGAPAEQKQQHNVPGPLFSSICWTFKSEAEAENFCLAELGFEMMQLLRKADESKMVKIPLLVMIKNLPQETRSIASSACRCEPRPEDRRRIALKLLAKRTSTSLSAQTLHLSIALLDKVLEVLVVEPEALMDIGTVCMVLASKMEEYHALQFSEVCHWSENNITIKELGVLEKLVMMKLNFSLNPATPFLFSNFMLIKLAVTEEQIHLTHYLLELALLALPQRANTSVRVAHAAVCLAYSMLPKTRLPTCCDALDEAEHELSVFSQLAIKSTRPLMALLVQHFEEAKEQEHIIFVTYKVMRRKNVSLATIEPQLVEKIVEGQTPTNDPE